MSFVDKVLAQSKTYQGWITWYPLEFGYVWDGLHRCNILFTLQNDDSLFFV